MATQFDRWEKDPFFFAAEEVQESADRMESTYRTWIHSKKDTSGIWNQDELQRDLRTALGTTKWQLDEFERAVRLSYTSTSADDAKHRHSEFIVAIQSQISKVENSLNVSAVSRGKPPLPWMRLDDGERNELAAFLSGPLASADEGQEGVNSQLELGSLKKSSQMMGRDPTETGQEKLPGHRRMASAGADISVWNSDEGQEGVNSQLKLGSLKKSSQMMGHDPVESGQEKLPGHLRMASAGAEISVWKIAIADDVLLQSSPEQLCERPPRKISSFSGFLNTMDSATKLKWSKNGYRKLKTTDCPSQQANTIIQSQHFSRGINACYERSKSCLDSCDECYDKQLYGWYGALQRQLQRSQYYMQYNGPTKVVVWIFLLLCLIVVSVLHVI